MPISQRREVGISPEFELNLFTFLVGGLLIWGGIPYPRWALNGVDSRGPANIIVTPTNGFFMFLIRFGINYKRKI